MVSVKVEQLSVSLGGVGVLHGIDTLLEPGRLIGIIGPNGAGKSTLARAIAALVPPDGGRVLIDGEDVALLGHARLARRMAFLPQGQTVHWPLSVERLVALGRLPHLGPFSGLSSTDRDAVDRAIERADLAALRSRTVTELSGGERARALIARALAVEAPVLIVDEPLAALDPGHQLQLMELLKAEAQGGKLVVAILHDLGMAARFCDRLLLIHEGRLVVDGAPAEALTPANLDRCYAISAWTGTIEGQPVVLPLGRSSSSPPGAAKPR